MAEKEYIEREAALSAQNKSMNLSECRKRLERIPAADVKPVVRGKWIAVASARGGHECSECYEYAPSFQNGVEHTTNYCPNCGAMMEESLWLNMLN